MSQTRVTVHFVGGHNLSTVLGEADLEDKEVETYEELLEKELTMPPRPHWCWIGDLYVFTQAVSGVEMVETG